jgi:thiol-disulfide isomerase/thioredoxin
MGRIKSYIAVGVLTAAAIVAGAPKAVDIVLQDGDGQRVRLRDYRGKPVVLNFWATWCGPCRTEMPLLAEAEKEYKSHGVVFIGASLDEAKARNAIRNFVETFQIGFTVWYGATGDDLDRLGLGNAVPATVFLDSEGRVVARVLGQIRKEELIERLEWLTGDRSGPAPKPVVKHLPN